MGARAASRRRSFHALLGGFVLASLLVVGWIGARLLGRWRGDPIELPAWLVAPEERVAKGLQTVVDPVIGTRPRRSFVAAFEIAPLGGRPLAIRRCQNNLGLIRTEDVVELPEAPRILLVGDSHLMGVVSNADNASDRLERALHGVTGFEHAVVYNGSCATYSLYQEVLRVRTLVDTLRPHVVVLAVFLGNDFLELEDRGRPHLDDDGRELPADPNPPAETTTARRQHLGLPNTDLLFTQGLNQACYFQLDPSRFEPVLAKSRRCLELAEELAASHDFRLVAALVPSYDLVSPDRVSDRGERVASVVRARWNEQLRDRLRALLADRGIPSVDVVEDFRADGRDLLYAADYHLFAEGHRILAERMLETVVAAFR